METFLYTLIDQAQLSESLEAFFVCSGLPMRLLDHQGEVLLQFGEDSSYCRLYENHFPPGDTCPEHHIRAAARAQNLGEPYLFACHAGLNHLVFPLIHRASLLGAVLAGPFLMHEPDVLLFQGVTAKYPLPRVQATQLPAAAGELPVIPPEKVTQLSHLLLHLLRSLILDSRQQQVANQEKLHQQSLIHESIQAYKFTALPARTYPADTEKELLTCLKTGNLEEAEQQLNRLLGFLLLEEGNRLQTLRNRALELCTLMSRSALEGGADSSLILPLNSRYLELLLGDTTMENICHHLSEILKAYMECMFSHISGKNSGLMKKAIAFLVKNYPSPITLQDAAEEVHLNPSYFSSLFHRTTGLSFRSYLNKVRIEEAKRLLSSTDYPLLDIAIAVGFEDPSYFTKVFKKYTGVPPSQFR